MLNENGTRKSIGQKTIIGIVVFTLLLSSASQGMSLKLWQRHSQRWTWISGIISKSFQLSPPREKGSEVSWMPRPRSRWAYFLRDGFVKDAPQFDDITMLAFRYNGKQ